MLAVVEPVGKGSFLPQQMSAVEQHYFGQIARCLRTHNRAAKPIAYQSWKVPRMVKVRVAQHHRVEAARCHWKRRPIAQP